MTAGWKCPVCGAGVAPSVERCPCAKADKAGGLGEAAQKALEELQKAAPRIPPIVRPLTPYSPPWYPRHLQPFPARPPSDATPWNDPGPIVWCRAPGIGPNMGMATPMPGIAQATVQ